MKTRYFRRWWPVSLAGLALLGLNGCALLPDEGDKARFMALPALRETLAEASQGDEAAVRLARHWPRAEWWRDFHNDPLNRLVETALRDNPDLQAAVARLRQAEAVADYQAAEMLPAIDSHVVVLRGRFSAHDIYGALGGHTGTAAYVDPVVFHYHLDLWGKDRAALEAASGLARAHGAELALARLVLGTAVARTYFRLCAADEEARFTAELTKSAEEQRRLAELRLARGLGTRDPLHAAEQRVALARQREAALLAETRILRHRLAALAGQGPDWGLHLPVSASEFAERFPLPENLPLALLAHRPDVAAARWRAEAAAKALHVAKTNFYPDINLVGFAGLRSVNIKDLFLSHGASLAYSVGPTLTLPLFDGGRLRAELKNQAAAYDAAVENYNRTVLDAVQQVADALAEWRKSQAEDAAQEQAVHAAASQAGLVGHRQAAGLATRMETLAAEEILLEQRLRLSVLQAEHFEHVVGLIAALGGGYQGAAPGTEVASHDQ